MHAAFSTPCFSGNKQMNGQIPSMDEFWPFYVSQHLNRINRRLHAYGTSLGTILLLSGIIWRAPLVAFSGVVAAYGFAWAGHFFFERNRPATFSYPWLSLRADFRMYWLTLLGEMDAEILLQTRNLSRRPRG